MDEVSSYVCLLIANERVDTPRWYYARNRWEEGDAVLAQLNDAPIDSEKVQYTRREILAAIEAELEANSSLHWKQFLTMGIVDKTRMKIIRRLCMCFWLPMIREWMGSSLIAYYSQSPSFNIFLLHVPRLTTLPLRLRHPLHDRETLTRVSPLWCPKHLLRPRLRAPHLHHRACRPPQCPALRRHDNDGSHYNLHRPRRPLRVRSNAVGRNGHHLPLPVRLRLRLAGLRVAVLL